MAAQFLMAGITFISVWVVIWLSTNLYTKAFALGGAIEEKTKQRSLSDGGDPSQKKSLTSRIDLIKTPWSNSRGFLFIENVVL